MLNYDTLAEEYARHRRVNPAVLRDLGDARACLDVGLMRPAIVLMGVAYEVAIERFAETLATKGHLKQADLELNAAKLLSRVKAQVKNVLQDKEHQFAADAACDFAGAERVPADALGVDLLLPHMPYANARVSVRRLSLSELHHLSVGCIPIDVRIVDDKVQRLDLAGREG
jgi:hypothetical protein